MHDVYLQDGLTTNLEKECTWRHYNLTTQGSRLHVDPYGMSYIIQLSKFLDDSSHTTLFNIISCVAQYDYFVFESHAEKMCLLKFLLFITPTINAK